MGHYDCKSCDASPFEAHAATCERNPSKSVRAVPVQRRASGRSCWTCIHSMALTSDAAPWPVACVGCGPHRLNHETAAMNIPEAAQRPQLVGRPESVPPIPKRRPKLLVIGHGRHGKDTVAEILRDQHGFTFASSSFFAAESVVRPALAACGVTYDSLEACYADRANHRAFWYEAISTYNSGGRSRLAEAILVDHDIYVGMRSAAEYAASRDLFDLVVWVDASRRGLPPEPVKSMDIVYDPKTMNLIDNGGSLADLEKNVADFARALTWGFP